MPAPPTIRQGSTGPYVTLLQQRLGLPLQRFGTFDRYTHDRVVAFQRSRGLTPDGRVGPLTWAALGVTSATPAPGLTVNLPGVSDWWSGSTGGGSPAPSGGGGSAAVGGVPPGSPVRWYAHKILRQAASGTFEGMASTLASRLSTAGGLTNVRVNTNGGGFFDVTGFVDNIFLEVLATTQYPYASAQQVRDVIEREARSIGYTWEANIVQFGVGAAGSGGGGGGGGGGGNPGKGNDWLVYVVLALAALFAVREFGD